MKHDPDMQPTDDLLSEEADIRAMEYVCNSMSPLFKRMYHVSSK
jgi:hypothetical protein